MKENGSAAPKMILSFSLSVCPVVFFSLVKGRESVRMLLDVHMRTKTE